VSRRRRHPEWNEYHRKTRLVGEALLVIPYFALLDSGARREHRELERRRLVGGLHPDRQPPYCVVLIAGAQERAPEVTEMAKGSAPQQNALPLCL
jgi:hypothetical protein